MQNQLNKYIGRDVKKIVKNVNIVSAVAKTGNPYTCVDIVLINGYTKRLFLKSEEEFCFTNAIELLDTQTIVDMD